MTAGARAGTHVLAVDHESTTFNTVEADFDSVKKRLPTWDVSPGFKHQAVENSSVRVDLGEHPPGIGIAHPESELSFTTYLQGLGTAAGDQTLAVANGFSHLLAASLGGSQVASTGSTVATSGYTAGPPNTVKETDAANHADDTLVGFADDSGNVRVRPVGIYATDTMTLLMDLPASISDANVIYGGINVQSAEDSLFVMQGELIGKNDAQHYDFFGSVGNFSIPEMAEGEAQTITFTQKIGDFARYPGDAPTQTAPAILRPLVNAGSEFLIAQFGSSVTTELALMRIGVELARTYAPNPDANDSTGICGWVLTDQQTRVTLHVLDTQAMPSGFTVANYFSSFGSSTLTENDYHLLLNWGQLTAGRIFSLYFPRLHLVAEPEPVDIDGIAAQKLTFALTQGQYDSSASQDDTSGVAKIWAAQH